VRPPILTRSDTGLVPVSTVIAIPDFNPKRFISRSAWASRSETLLITAGSPHAQFDNSTSCRALGYPISPPTGLLGVGSGGNHSPRMNAFQARLDF